MKIWEPIATAILEGAYEGTLLAGVILSRHRKCRIKIYLTLLGNGAFGNPTLWVYRAIEKALNKFKNENIDVYLVHYMRKPKDIFIKLEEKFKRRHKSKR